MLPAAQFDALHFGHIERVNRRVAEVDGEAVEVIDGDCHHGRAPRLTDVDPRFVVGFVAEFVGALFVFLVVQTDRHLHTRAGTEAETGEVRLGWILRHDAIRCQRRHDADQAAQFVGVGRLPLEAVGFRETPGRLCGIEVPLEQFAASVECELLGGAGDERFELRIEVRQPVAGGECQHGVSQFQIGLRAVGVGPADEDDVAFFLAEQ